MGTSLKAFEPPIPANGELSSESEGPTHLQELNLAEYISQPILVVGSNGYGEYFNTQWRSYTGLSEEESLDFGWSQALHPEDRGNFMRLLRNSGRSGDWEYETRLRRGSDGSYRQQLCRCTVLANQSEGLLRLLVCCTDVEDWREAEAKAKERGALLRLAMRSNDQEKRKIAA
jgi:PAS domain S-box-containing protein